MEKTIKIKTDEKTGKIGFIVQQDKGSSESIEEVLKFIGVLENLKQLQLDKIALKGTQIIPKDE